MVRLLAFARWEYPTCFWTLDVIPTRKHYGHYDESASFGLTSTFNCLTFENWVRLNAGGPAIANLATS